MFTTRSRKRASSVGRGAAALLRPTLRCAFPLLAALAFAAAPIRAQLTRSDTAAVLLDAARTFEEEGRLDLAEQLLTVLTRRYPDTASGRLAGSTLSALRAEREVGGGHAGYVVWSTIFGAWMGVAVPAAVGAEDPEPFGLGLLLGTPAAFFASRAYGSSAGITVGASRTVTFSWLWGTWQALGWRAALDLGESLAVCGIDGCYKDTDEQAPWIAALVGGASGYAAGIAATRLWNVETGTAEMLWHSSVWGTGYGFALGFLADLEDDDLLASTLIGGNAGLVVGIPLARAWSPTSGQVRLVSVAGLAGALAGLGVDLLLSVDSDKTAVAIPTVGATLGLIGGSLLTANENETARPDRGDPAPGTALVRYRNGFELGVPIPVPVARLRLMPDGRASRSTGVGFTLFQATF